MYAYNKVQELYSCNNARRNEMNFFVINAKSMTQAEKARLYLARSGIKSVVMRTTGRSGCTFSLKIFGEKGTVCPLLSRVGISCDIPR